MDISRSKQGINVAVLGQIGELRFQDTTGQQRSAAQRCTEAGVILPRRKEGGSEHKGEMGERVSLEPPAANCRAVKWRIQGEPSLQRTTSEPKVAQCNGSSNGSILVTARSMQVVLKIVAPHFFFFPFLVIRREKNGSSVPLGLNLCLPPTTPRCIMCLGELRRVKRSDDGDRGKSL